MVDLKQLNDELYEIVHLNGDWLTKCQSFKCNPRGYGLEQYLKINSLADEESNVSRTYLIVDTTSKEVAAYFTLRTGLITVSRGLFRGFDTQTGIELANFAINESYRHANSVIPKFGSYIFYNFILPLVQSIGEYVGARYLYIFALPNDSLMSHYKTLGFEQTSQKMERYVYRHVKPAYDKNCRFMYQLI